MAANSVDAATRRAIEDIAKALQANEFDELRLAYTKGEISAGHLINEIAARYQRGIGSAVQALAEHDKTVAQQVGERLKARIDEQLQTLANRDEHAASKKTAKTTMADGLRDREDAVLQREYVILKILSKSDIPLKASALFERVRGYDVSLSDNAITTNLGRMVDRGMIGKASKGRYHSVAASPAHVHALADAIEARGLTLPKVAD